MYYKNIYGYKGCEKSVTLTHCWWECKMMWQLWKTVWWLLKVFK